MPSNEEGATATDAAAGPSSPAAQTEIIEMVEECLLAISGQSPCGEAAPDEFAKLNTGLDKASPDYETCALLAEETLKSKSKDLHIAARLCFIWYRLHGITGYRNGLLLLIGLLTRYGDKLFPAKTIQRAKAMQFLNSTNFVRLFQTETVDAQNAATVQELPALLSEIKRLCSEQFKGNEPSIGEMIQTVKAKAETAFNIIKKQSKPATASTAETKTTSAPKQAAQADTSEKTTPPAPDTQVPKKEVISDKDLIPSLRKVLQSCFKEKLSDGTSADRISETEAVYALSRTLQWYAADQEDPTLLEAPNTEFQKYVVTLFEQQNWNALIPLIEHEFLNSDSGIKYWLDAQRYVVHALQQKAGRRERMAAIVKGYLSLLLVKRPDLLRLKFKDSAETPLANAQTVEWLEAEVVANVSAGSTPKMELSPIMGEEYQAIHDEFEALSKKPNEEFAEKIALLEKGIAEDLRPKGRFLRRLNVANLCLAAKQVRVAQVHFAELEAEIDRLHLQEWEPALCLSVWQSYFLTQKQLVTEKGGDQDETQDRLFQKIAKYDIVRAMKLSGKIQKNGGK